MPIAFACLLVLSLPLGLACHSKPPTPAMDQLPGQLALPGETNSPVASAEPRPVAPNALAHDALASRFPGSESEDLSDPLVQVRLLSLGTVITRGSETTVALQLTIAPGWHVYWPGANDTGLPLSVTWDVPQGVDISPLFWPAPTRYSTPDGFLDHVFFDELTLLATVAAAEDFEANEFTMTAQLDWLVCEEACLPGDASVSITLPVVAATANEPATLGTTKHAAALIQAARAALPGSPPAALSVRWQGDEIQLTVPGAQRLAFYPQVSSLALAELLTRGDSPGDELQLLRDRGFTGGTRLQGLLAVWDNSTASPHFSQLDIAPPDVALPKGN
ncbi:MAG: DsbC/DsbD-like thiol-disulfide interchange protein [Pseudohongiellaceae bacterium]|jgi:DsbC/DsbD-like thiol-disulfide interchange protein